MNIHTRSVSQKTLTDRDFGIPSRNKEELRRKRFGTGVWTKRHVQFRHR